MIALLGLFGVGNIGNDSTLQAMVYQLQKRQPEVKLLCITPAAESQPEVFGIPTIPMMAVYEFDKGKKNRIIRLIEQMMLRIRAELRRIPYSIQQLQKVEKLIIPGTGALDDFGSSPLRIPFSFLYWCALARLLGASVDIVSVGVGPIVHPLSRVFFVNVLRLANYRSYRDIWSRNYLKAIGFNSEPDPVCPDLAFSFPVDALMDCRLPASPPAVVGIGVMAYYGWQNDPAKGEVIYQKYIEKICRFISWLFQEGYNVRLLIGRDSDKRAVDDIILTLSRNPTMPLSGIFSNRIETSEDLISAISHTDIVVGTRFHNIIFALMLGRPVVSIGYASKFEALLDDVGLTGYHQHTENIDFDRLKKQFQSLIDRYPEVQQLIIEKNQQYRELLDQQYDSLFTQNRA